jgi:hypothetical protein
VGLAIARGASFPQIDFGQVLEMGSQGREGNVSTVMVLLAARGAWCGKIFVAHRKRNRDEDRISSQRHHVQGKRSKRGEETLARTKKIEGEVVVVRVTARIGQKRDHCQKEGSHVDRLTCRSGKLRLGDHILRPKI